MGLAWNRSGPTLAPDVASFAESVGFEKIILSSPLGVVFGKDFLTNGLCPQVTRFP